MALQATRPSSDSLADVIDRVLDKGLIINADIAISLAGAELLGIKIRAALASFETAARYGLQFPSGTRLDMPVWQDAIVEKEICPQCNKKVAKKELMDAECPWCGFATARAIKAAVKG